MRVYSPNQFIPYLFTLYDNEESFQVVEIFLNFKKDILERFVCLIRIDSNAINASVLRRIKPFQLPKGIFGDGIEIYNLPSVVHSKSSIINEYHTNSQSLSSGSSSYIEVKIVNDFKLVAPTEYSHSHKTAYEEEYRDFLINNELRSFVSIPIYIRGMKGVLRGMNFARWDKSGNGIPTDIEKNEIKKLFVKTAKQISSELTFIDERIFAVSSPDIFLSEAERDIKASIQKSWIGESPTYNTICSMAAKYSKSYSPLLIYGPTGTGKTYLAKAIATVSSWHKLIGDRELTNHYIHADGTIQEDKFVEEIGIKHNPNIDAINIASIPSTLFESELYGIVSGVATNVNARLGILSPTRIENGSKKVKTKKYITKTVLLDEIGEIDPQHQAKLLVAIDEHQIRPVGSDKVLSIKGSRIIACTNKDINDEGIFRKDLKVRFPHIIYLPPLSERKDDIVPLADFIIKDLAKRHRFEYDFVDEDIFNKALFEYSWPGNVRELMSVLRDIATNNIRDNFVTFDYSLLPTRLRIAYSDSHDASEIKAISFEAQDSSSDILTIHKKVTNDGIDITAYSDENIQYIKILLSFFNQLSKKKSASVAKILSQYYPEKKSKAMYRKVLADVRKGILERKLDNNSIIYALRQYGLSALDISSLRDYISTKRQKNKKT